MTDGASAAPPQAPPAGAVPPVGPGYVPTQAYPQASAPGQAPPAGPGYVPTQAYPQAQPPPAGYAPQAASPGQGYAPPGQGYAPTQGPPAQGYPPPYGGYGPAQGGYPQQPVGYQPPPQAYPRRGPGKGAVFGIVAGVVILAVIATLVIALSNKTKSNDSAGGPTLAKAWSVPSSGSDDRILGSWLTATTVIRASSGDGVVAYDLTTGRKSWTLTPPAGAATPCAMSQGVNASGIGAMAFGTNAESCTYFAAVDSATGRILWKLNLTNSDHPVATSATALIQGSVATVLSLGRAGGFDAKTGKQIWVNPSRGSYCNEESYGTTGVVVVEDYCADASPKQTMTALDASTGKRLWRRTETTTAVESYMLNASPLVAQLSSELNGPVDVYSSKGVPTPLDMTGFSVSSDSVTPVKAAGNTLVVQSGEDLESAGSDSTAGQVIAFNLSTGQQLWRYNGESGHGAVLARTASDGKLYALSTGTYSGSPHFVRLDPVTGKSTVLGALPSGTDGWTVSGGTLYALPGGGLLVLNSFGSAEVPAVEAFK
ncbi:PQQ-binding-like beta-propeller repeat protein [Streptacidiphilus sp. N1-12]|uniref:PQQ-binding-like beta-propeller repeat protein n=2 Tax=Streptacidiphilus alkalitolerans TaxID=3342712 RepID=A0ABV6WJP6_9ACTN